MYMELIIGTVITLSIIVFWILVFYKTKDRKETLTIIENDDVIKLLLTDDDYYEFDVSNIKNDKEQIYNEIKNVIKNKSKELVKFVDRVTFYANGNKQKEQELLNIILSSKKV